MFDLNKDMGDGVGIYVRELERFQLFNKLEKSLVFFGGLFIRFN